MPDSWCARFKKPPGMRRFCGNVKSLFEVRKRFHKAESSCVAAFKMLLGGVDFVRVSNLYLKCGKIQKSS